MKKWKVAVVVQGRMSSGGVTTVAKFIIDMLKNDDRFDVELIMAATSFNDDLSTRILRPSTWFRGVKVQNMTWETVNTYAVGANFTELEIQRYMPRKKMTDILNSYDIIQVVSGSPAIAYITRNVSKPVCLFIATMLKLERSSLLKQVGTLRGLYERANLPLVSMIDRLALKRVNHVFAETLYTKQAITPYVDVERISIDTVGVDIKRFIPSKKRSDNYILCTGRLDDPRKNTPMLFRAYAEVKRRVPRAPKLVLAGLSGPTEADWQLARELNIYDEIQFHHRVSAERMVELYQNAMLFVLSSNEEGLGIVLLEAMACGTPVISTRCGGPDSVVSEDVGFLVSVGDFAEMSDRIVGLIDDPHQRRMMGEAGRKMVERRFSNEFIAEKYINVYLKLLNGVME